MSALDIVLSILDIILGLTMVILFLVQEGNDQGMGAITGASNDSYYSKAKGQTLEERLKQATKIVAVLFAFMSVVLYMAVTKGF
ncbi:MAG: preprotein translocase subunit SecG [Saccharofermentans sp.]|jgi:preprotein translocase subunit SecG|nr:preprotein translocase subunit SecG [Clostridiales bacterium]MBR4495012.1 preprotein translocase subunit SecG [Clostridiales bacterium]MCR5048193.1 preprotein translocase subunit SecG [Saccharofermentans sp.]